jgi:hypothetical protein
VFTGAWAAALPAPESHSPYGLLLGSAGFARGRGGFRDSRSTDGVDLAGCATVVPRAHISELGPGYRLLYSPVGKPPASFRSIEAAASGGPLALW